MTPLAVAPSPKSQAYEAIDPSSVDAEPSNVHERWVRGEENAAVGAGLTGPETVGWAVKLLNVTTGVFVEVLEEAALRPTDPAACRAAVESRTVSVQPVGSVVPAAQTRARTVVGPVPVTCNRTGDLLARRERQVPVRSPQA